MVPDLTDSSPWGETLLCEDPNQDNYPTTELLVYTRRKSHTNREQPHLIQDQSAFPRSDLDPLTDKHKLGNISDSQPIFITHLPSTSQPNVFSDLDIPIANRKGVQKCTIHLIAKYLSYHRLSENYKAFTSKISHLLIPRNIQEALGHPNWKVAVMKEMNALAKNKTWVVDELPKGKKTVGCKWVFTNKCRADRFLERHKACLVAKCFTQTYDLDYQENFAPVAKINTIRILLSAFMDPPPRLEGEFKNGKVCRLVKSLYGLKQSPRAWFEKFGKVVRRFGYNQSQGDHTLFFKRSSGGKKAILIVYVDDIIMTSDDIEEIGRLKRLLAQEFEVKDLGDLKYFLGMEFARSKRGIFVSQRKYILDLLGEIGMTGCRAVETPIEPNLKLEAAKPESQVDREQYQRLVGKLIYLAHTRPDISFEVNMVSQFMHSLGPEHNEAALRILRYLKRTPGKGLLFANRGHFQVEVFTDADWSGSVIDKRSRFGYCTFVGGNLVT
ncbi:hypothetical protein LWI29_024799 [Acer saccharum]|uniref:Reverse transcriptase Ty1/copia-type domain-containing protein n=1 Tax=Acer saccharum TaxID=4024 RepID=A0AA39VLI0_ACESA|nr:hypothetical protein LWI29_024799 [Acer saccharum]